FLHQSDKGAGEISYRGRDNCFHDLDGYWVMGIDWRKASWGEFRRKVKGQDDSRVLAVSPWATTAKKQQQRLEKQKLKRAFEADLELASLRKTGQSKEVVGVESLLGVRWLPATLPVIDDKSGGGQPSKRVLVVEEKSDDSHNYVYKSLDLAVRSAEPGD